MKTLILFACILSTSFLAASEGGCGCKRKKPQPAPQQTVTQVSQVK